MNVANWYRELDFESLDPSVFERRNIIYGAGYNGKLLFQKCKEHNIEIVAFFDDDALRGGANIVL